MKEKVSILVLSKNEEEGVVKVLRSLKPFADEILVIDGRSKDKTVIIAQKEGVKVLLDNGKGKGAGVRLGLQKVKNDIIIIFDADGSPDPKDIPHLLLSIQKEKADLVITSRRTGGSFDFTISIDGILRTLGSDFMAYLVNKRFKTNFSDILYSFRAIRKSCVKSLGLRANGFDIEQEMLVSALKNNLRIVEIPSRERKRKWGKSKLKTVTGLRLLYKLFKVLYF